jgi:hypothetical protein
MSLFDRCFRWLNLKSADSPPSNEHDISNSEKCHNKTEGNYREVFDCDADSTVLKLDRASDNCNYDINDDVHITNISSKSNKYTINDTKNNLIKINKNNSEKSSGYVSRIDGNQILKESNSSFLDLLVSTKNNISQKMHQGRIRAVETISNMYTSEKSNCSSSSSRSTSSCKSCETINDIHRIASEKSRVPECVICLVEFSEGKLFDLNCSI